MPALGDVVSWLDTTLRTADVPDYPQALNGLQVENRGEVHRVAVAVDFSAHTARAAGDLGADLLVVHHGMFWGGAQPVRGARYAALTTLIENDIAVYASHLPLDVHPELGNNPLLAAELGLEPTTGFARFQEIDVGVSGEGDVATAELVRRATAFAHAHGGAVVATAFPAERRTRRWAICTGAGASSSTIAEAVARGIDTLIVGEGPHHTAVEARDAEIVVIYAGHYATETLGVNAVGVRLSAEFQVPSHFIAAPTGL